jgi:hypothetical protein
MRTRFGALALMFATIGCAGRADDGGAPAEPPVARARQASRKVASMKVARVWHSMLTMADGRVFASGTKDPSGVDEIYDPKTDQWTTAPTRAPLDFAPIAHGAGDTIVIFGALSSGRAPIFQPSGPSWIETANAMAVDRYDHVAVTLADGRVMLVGGALHAGGETKVAEIYDPATRTFTSTGSLTVARDDARASRLTDGKVVVTGGRAVGTYFGLSTAEIWDPTSGAFSPFASMATGRYDHVAEALPGGRLLVAGGTDESDRASDVCELYDPTLGWGLTGRLAETRASAASTRLPDGRVLIVGGFSADALSTTEIWDPVGGNWSAGPKLQEARIGPAIARLDDGSYLVTGGTAAGTHDPLSSAEILSLAELGLDAGVADARPDASSDGGAPVVAPGDFHACKLPSDCASGFCVDGVCCDKACDGACESCALPTSPGKCALQPYGTDLRHRCGAANSCSSTCDGAGACVAVRGGEQCAPSKCTDQSHGVGPAVCAAAGASCPTDTTPFDCHAYACEPAFGACLSSCISSDQCAPGYTCDVASKSCTQELPSKGDDCGCSAPGAGATDVAATIASTLAACAILLARRRRAR